MNKSLSPLTIELIQEIYRDRGLWQRLTWRDPGVEQVRLVAAQHEPLAVRDLFPLVFATSKQLAEASADAIHHLVGLLPPRDLPWLDEQIRESHCAWLSAWSEIWRTGSCSRRRPIRSISGTVLSGTSIQPSASGPSIGRLDS